MSDTADKTLPYKNQLLDHLIDATLDAIKRARAALMLGMVIVFVFGVTIFNAELSWNKGQIERRAKLYAASVKGYDAIESLTNCHDHPTECDKTISSALNDGEGELGYLSPIWKAYQEKHKKITDPNSASSIEITELRAAIFSDLNLYIGRRVGFDTVGIPFIGGLVTGTDYGIVGGLALVIVGYWLLAMLRREHLTLNEFVRIDSRTGKLIPGFSKYKPEELIYACKRIKHYMVFSVSERGSRLGYVTAAIFVAGPALLMTNHLLTAIDVTSKNLGGYIQWHVIVELIVAILGVVIWVNGLLYQYNSMLIMQYWESEAQENEPFKGFTEQMGHAA